MASTQEKRFQSDLDVSTKPLSIIKQGLVWLTEMIVECPVKLELITQF